MIIALGCFVLGIVCGRIFVSPQIIEWMNFASTLGLVILTISVGIDIGLNKSVFGQIKEIGIKVLLIPLGVILGTMIGGALVCLCLGAPLKDGMSVVIGMGFSSVAMAILKELSGIQLATVAFFANLLRTLLSYALIPIVAKKLNFITAIAPGGVTSMDLTLPAISRNTDAKTVVLAVLNGALLTALAPAMIPLFYAIF